MEFRSLEARALERCTGRVLDCGAGTGRHSLVLQVPFEPAGNLEVIQEAR